jgi:diguanylate cyclase (GGDEF)-like protein/PAS domain S-box-containing protein
LNPTPRPQVLIVDDQPDNVEVLGEALAELCDISFALSGPEALAQLQDATPDLILLDVMMPGMDGYAVMQALRQHPRASQVPVIFVTAHTGIDSELRALGAGAVDFIHKPIHPAVVEARVRTQLNTLAQQRQLHALNQTLHDKLAELRRAHEEVLIFRTAIEQSPVSVMVTDTDGLIGYINPQYERVSGYSAQETLGRRPSLFKSGLTDPEVYRDMWQTLGRRECWLGELVNRSKSGAVYTEEAHIAPVLNPEGQPTHYVAIKLDITERKRAQDQLSHLAHFDALTDLPNRQLFFDRLAQALALAQRQGHLVGLLFMDLDKFKPINDTHGHGVGDVVLQTVARRIEGCLRASDTVGRIGGDEFVVLLPQLQQPAEALQVAEKIRLALEQPMPVGALTLAVSACIGVALYPQHGHDTTELAKNADTAMYQAKVAGRNQAVLFDASLPAAPAPQH